MCIGRSTKLLNLRQFHLTYLNLHASFISAYYSYYLFYVFCCSTLKFDIDKPALVAMEEVPSLEPGQIAKRTLLVRFHHHLLPLKLALFCNDKKFPVKLRPDIGYFVKPLAINIEAFRDKESCLPGMFEYVRRYDIIIYYLLDTSSQDSSPIP